jgi:hypothetical protein
MIRARSRRGAVLAASASGPSKSQAASVRQVGNALPPLAAAQLFFLRRVTGPLRRRFWRVDPNPLPPLTGPQILERVADLPISFWTYEFEPGVRHLGPMAQDFAAAFGLGRTNRMIEPIDEGGVALAAIQALHLRVRHLEAEVARLRAQEGDTPPPEQG